MVKPGFKKTDVGVIPEDWSVANIGAFNPFVTSGSRGWAEYYSEFGDPFIRITNMSRKKIDLDQSNLRFVTLPKNSAEGKRTNLQNDDILISITADIGICSYVDESLAKPAYINQHIALVRFEDAEIFPKYVNYFLASDPVQRLFTAGSDTGAKAGMNLEGIRSIKFAKPSADEQEAIAGALSDVDGLIAGLEALIAKKRSLKTATMQQLLTGKTRLPGFGEGVGMKQTELGVLPEDWDVERLGQLAEMKSGAGITSASISDDDEFPCFGGNGLRGFTSTKTHSGEFPLIGRQGAHCGNVQFAKGDFFASEHAIVLTAKPDVFPLWLNYILTTRNLNRLSESSAQPGLSVTKLRALTYRKPADEEEQKAIASVIQDIDFDIEGIEARLLKAKALKQGMMQELLTGRTRLI